jgi:enoyl-CoA hydratase/carnithine racemase
VIDLKKQGDVFILHMQSGENRFNRDFLTALSRALDEVQASTGPAALVTLGEGKFFSNGLDLDWLGAQPGDAIGPFLADFEGIFARLLAFPMITVAALNGHTFAGGAMFSLAHDFRVMRRDRGFWCLPEIDLGMPLRPGMNALISARLPRRTFHEAIVTGRRYPAEAALEAGIVQATADEGDVLSAAVALAVPHASKSRQAMSALKREMYAGALAVLEAHAEHRP